MIGGVIPALSKLLRRDCWLVSLEAHSLWNDQAGVPVSRLRDPVAGRAQHRIGRIDRCGRAHRAAACAKVVEGLGCPFPPR